MEPRHFMTQFAYRACRKAAARPTISLCNFYQTVDKQVLGIEAREHTAQVPSEQREEREANFRTGELPILYCSPTMELGVDISELNAVNMRNVPPTPANYAQRSGRAGRSGQPAMVFTYCTIGSPHDQYYFKRPGLMVSGAVAPPRIDLTNEDLDPQPCPGHLAGRIRTEPGHFIEGFAWIFLIQPNCPVWILCRMR